MYVQPIPGLYFICVSPRVAPEAINVQAFQACGHPALSCMRTCATYGQKNGHSEVWLKPNDHSGIPRSEDRGYCGIIALGDIVLVSFWTTCHTVPDGNNISSKCCRQRFIRHQLLTISELLCQPNEDTFGAADVAETVNILIPNHLADDLRAVRTEPGEGVVDVLNSEHDAQIAERVYRRVAVIGDDSRGKKP